MNKKFGTVLNCIDGRVQIPVTNWMMKNFNLDYVDSITRPGMDKALSEFNPDEILSIKNDVITSISAHDSKIVAVVGHYDCAANPVSPCKHFQDIICATYTVSCWCFPIKVIGLWVDENSTIQIINDDM